VDPQVQAQIDNLDVSNGIRLRSEIRTSRGLVDDGTPDFIMTVQGPVLVSDIGKEPEPEPGNHNSDGSNADGGGGPEPSGTQKPPPQKLAKTTSSTGLKPAPPRPRPPKKET